MMLNKFLMKKFLVLALLVTSAVTPAAYAQQQTAPSTSAQTILQSSADTERRVAAEPFIRTELFFGTARPDLPEVTDEEFQWFLNTVITPLFPDGLTLLSGIGQFRDAKGVIIQERSKLLILLYPLETRKSSGDKIEKIREAYKGYFQQQSVLRSDDRPPVWVSF